MKRRDFIKYGLAGSASLAFPSLLSANSLEFSDYKAIVILYLNGGNDGVNTFIPVSEVDDEYGYSAYVNSRGSLAVDRRDLTDN